VTNSTDTDPAWRPATIDSTTGDADIVSTRVVEEGTLLRRGDETVMVVDGAPGAVGAPDAGGRPSVRSVAGEGRGPDALVLDPMDGGDDAVTRRTLDNLGTAVEACEGRGAPPVVVDGPTMEAVGVPGEYQAVLEFEGVDASVRRLDRAVPQGLSTFAVRRPDGEATVEVRADGASVLSLYRDRATRTLGDATAPSLRADRHDPDRVVELLAGRVDAGTTELAVDGGADERGADVGDRP